MREIKFRFWDTKLNELICKGLHILPIPFPGECMMTGLLFKRSIERFNDILIEQFTGLRDKNGKEIYEGDIVKFEDVSGYKDGCASVIWHEDSCGYYLENDDDNIYDTLYDFTPSYQMEVIGNIHDNPELLEGRE